MTQTKLVPFDLERANNGAKVVTKNGLNVTIRHYLADFKFPIEAIVKDSTGKTECRDTLYYTKEGRFLNSSECDLDLLIEEEEEETDYYDPYKEAIEAIADMVKRYTELQSIEELKDFYNNVRVKCREAIEYYTVCEEPVEQKTEPKFKVGDFIVNDYCLGKIVTITDDAYLLDTGQGIFFSDNSTRLWDVAKDAKDGEQKSFNTVNPKFKVGDWIIKKNIVYHIDKISGVYLTLSTLDGTALVYHTSVLDSDKVHIWTIDDAKDGDVLAINNEVFIYAHKKQMCSIAVAHCFVDSAGGFYFDGEFGYRQFGGTILPATKEQRDFLFKKMKEAGYQWNSDKKELRQIDTDMAKKEVKTRRMTHKELSWWLRDCPNEHREWTYKPIENSVNIIYPYDESNKDEEVSKDVLIRENDGEWQEPLVVL